MVTNHLGGVTGVSAMVACYDEASTLERAIEEVLDALGEIDGEHEVVIIDDGSTDGSAAIADELAARHDIVRAVHHDRNQGLGGFYRSAFQLATREVVYFMAADLQPVPAEYFPTFLPLFATHDGVVGFDLRREAPLLSKFLSYGEKLLFGFLYPGVPKIGGPLMIRRSVIEATPLVLSSDEGDRSWMVLWELMIRARRAGVRFAQVPVRRRARARGSSRGSTIRTALAMLRRMHQLRVVLAGSD